MLTNQHLWISNYCNELNIICVKALLFPTEMEGAFYLLRSRDIVIGEAGHKAMIIKGKLNESVISRFINVASSVGFTLLGYEINIGVNLGSS